MKKSTPRSLRSKLATALTLLTVLASVVSPVQAAVTSPATPKITFAFDDGRVSTYTKAAPLLAKYGMSGTAYITTGCVGMTQTPNTCHAANDVSYMTWAQIKSLQNTLGWEIGSHSKTHPYMASTNSDDGQPNMLTKAQITSELVDSKADLAAHGIDAKAFASPYGDYNGYTLQETAQRYTSHRGFADQGNNVWPYNEMVLQTMQVQAPVTVAQVKAKINDAVANNRWLVLTFHDIKDKPSTNPNKYDWGTAQLDNVAAYVKSLQNSGTTQITNASGGIARGTGNLLPTGTFTNGLADWTTDTPAAFVSDAANNGTSPNPAYSIRLASSASASHLFSPKVAVNSDNMYLIKSFLNVTKMRTGGEVGYYIDEYDAAGNWVSGQYKARENTTYIERINLSYVPSSVRVTSASLQIYMTAGTGTTGFVDDVSWSIVASSPTVVQNLMPAGAFDKGLVEGWSTDAPSQLTFDTSNHGSPANPTGSIRFTSTTAAAHLFSPQIVVDATRSYYLENYLNIDAGTGEVGYYIDEYDAAGNWTSGQYKTTAAGLGSRTVVTTYTPSSSVVSRARLQIIIAPSSVTTTGYLDDSRWRAL